MGKIFPWIRKQEGEETKRPLADFHKWSFKELVKRERDFSTNDMRATELRAELGRRRIERNRRISLASVIAAAVSAFGSMIAAVASLLAIHPNWLP